MYMNDDMLRAMRDTAAPRDTKKRYYQYAFTSGKTDFTLPGFPGTALRVHNLKCVAASLQYVTGIESIVVTDATVPIKNKLNGQEFSCFSIAIPRSEALLMEHEIASWQTQRGGPEHETLYKSAGVG